MILFVFYAGAGVYLLLLAAGLLRPSFLRNISEHSRPNVRVALFFFGTGLILSSLYQAYVYYIVKPTLEGQKFEYQKTPER